MKEKINFSQVPHHYPMCQKRQCNKADTCLRQLVEQSIPTNIQHWVIINPKYQETLEDVCPHYRPAEKVRFAKGFIKILEGLPHKQMLSVISHLRTRFNQRTYYRIRKGERLLSPSEQQQFLNILKNCGVSHPQEFDAYIENFEW